MKASDKAAGKHNRSILLMGSLLAVAVSLNLYQYLHTANSVLYKSHNIQKEVIHEGIKWTEIRTETKVHDENGQYEIWLTPLGAQPELVETFSLDRFSDLTWQMNGKSGIDVSYWSGGPEGGTRETIVYSHTGDEQVKTSLEYPNDGNFAFSKPRGPIYAVSYVTDGACVGNTYENAGVPKVRIQGISIQGPGNVIQKFLLPEAGTTECGVIDDGFYNPPLEINNVSDEKIEFELTNGKTATINYGSANAPEVIFNE